MVWLLGVAAKGLVPPPVGSLPVVFGEMIDFVHKLLVPEDPSALSGGSSFALIIPKNLFDLEFQLIQID